VTEPGEDIWYESSDGLQLFARAYGPVSAGTTLLCMHGLTRNHKDFEPLIAALGRTNRFLAVDVRGRGRSQRASEPDDYTPATYVGDMAALLNRLGLQRVTLVGTSMGGLMAMLMARAMPERIEAIILNDVGPVFERAGLARIAAYAGNVTPFSDWQAAADAIARIQGETYPGFGAPDWMAFAQRTCRETDAGEVVADYDPAITRTIGEVKPGFFARRAMWRLFRATRARPLLVIRGETSDILSPKTARRMCRRHPDARLVTVPGVGHAPILDEPPAVAAISEFLKTLETA